MNIGNTLPYDFDEDCRNSYATYPNLHYTQAFAAIGAACTSNSQCGSGNACNGITHKCNKVTVQPTPGKPHGPQNRTTGSGGTKPPGLLDQAIAKGKEIIGGVTGGTPSAGDPLGLQKTIDNAFAKADARIDRIEGLANKGYGESDQWQATVDNIINQIQNNLPLVAVAGGGILVLLMLKR